MRLRVLFGHLHSRPTTREVSMFQRRRETLHDHIFATYNQLRFGMFFLAALFPFVLWLPGLWIWGIELQPSLSAYYFASPADDPYAFPTRTFLVGLLFAIGSFLFLYKGFTKGENRALNVAGVSALLVAIFPPDREGSAAGFMAQLSVHGTAAIVLFLSLAFVAIHCADRTLQYLPSRHRHLKRSFRVFYRVVGMLMIVSPLAAFGFTWALGDRARIVFWIESFGIWVFSAYWLGKSYEMSLTHAEERALKGPSARPKENIDQPIVGGTLEPAGA